MIRFQTIPSAKQSTNAGWDYSPKREENFRVFSNDHCYYPDGVLLWAQTNKSLFGEP
jgi:hypothetical protein